MRTKNSKVYDVIIERAGKLDAKHSAFVGKFMTNFGLLIKKLPDEEYFRKVMRADYIRRIEGMPEVYDDLKTFMINYVVTRINQHRNECKNYTNGTR